MVKQTWNNLTTGHRSLLEPSRAVVWIIGLVLVAVGTLYVLNALEAEYPWVNHDVGYHTYLGKEMASGARLYVDLAEDNPPGSPLLLGALFVIADALGVPDFAAQHLFVLTLGLAGFGVLRFALGTRPEGWVWPLTALAYLLVVIRGGFSNDLFVGAPGIPYDFGQREHLFSLLFVPYVLTRMHRDRSPWWFLMFAGLLGWVATFKPFWPAMILLVELFVRWRHRAPDWRVPTALVAGLLLPFACLALHSLDSLTWFVTKTIPTYFRGGYDFYENSYAAFLTTGLHHRMLIGLAACLLAAILAVRLKALAPASIGLLLSLAGLAYFSVWHQGKFWSYHTMPFFALTVVPAAFLVGVSLPRLARPVLGRVLAALMLVWSGTTVAGTARMLTRYPPLGSFLCPVVEPFDRVMYFSMSVMVQYPPLKLRREMIGRWTVYMDLPELLALPDSEERARRVTAFADAVRSTIERERPELLVFSPETQALPPGASLHDLLQRLDALPLAGYRSVSARTLGATAPWADEWILYVRADPRREPSQ